MRQIAKISFLVSVFIVASGAFGEGRERQSIFGGDSDRKEAEIAHGMAKDQEGVLVPGDTVSFRGGKVAWIPKEGTNGLLQYSSASAEVPDRTVEVGSWLKTYSSGSITWSLHLGETVLSLTASEKEFVGFNSNGHTLGNLKYRTFTQPLRQFFNAAPANAQIAVSNVIPVYLNEWEVRLSDETRHLPDGADYGVIVARNVESGTTVTFAETEGVRRRFGRFEAVVGNLTRNREIVWLKVTADPDLTIQGGDTYVPDGVSTEEDETLGDFLTRMSQQYGFEVEWIQYPDHPESVDFTKNHRLAERCNHSGGFLRDLMNDCMSSGRWRRSDSQSTGDGINLFSTSWPDPKHLKVEPKHYEEVLANKEKQERLNAEVEKAREEWKRDYQLEARVFRLETVTAITAKALIDQQLHTYVFDGRRIRSFDGDDEKSRTYPDRVVERCVADEQANATIVTAIPATHKKIMDLLAMMEAMADQEKEKGPVKQYRLEVVLLKGEQSVTSEKEPEAKPAAAVAGVSTTTTAVGLDTTIGELSIQNQSLLELADMLSTLGNTNINVAMNLDRYVTLNVRGKKTIRQLLEDLADLYRLCIDYQPRQTIIRDGQVPVQVTAPLAQYGISPEDLKVMGFSSVVELGRAVALLANQPGEEGKSLVSLTTAYACELEYLDVREPYLVAKGRLVENSGAGESGKTLLQTTLYLEPNKPTLLGLTNLREALILLVRRHGE